MQTIIGVRFKQAGKIYYFTPGELEIALGQQVIVETARGVECGTVVVGPREAKEGEAGGLPVVHRLATQSDLDRIEENKEREKEAFDVCEQKIREHSLPMKLVNVEYTFDMGKIIFYFTADGRIDFRELVKDLAAVFRTRIELRQIGVRDEAKLMGGIGCCGRPLCCASFLGDFEPVSIRMAKEQNLSLNPTKISGICGRLMCCLKFENDCYAGGCCRQERRPAAPEQGSRVVTVDGEGKVISLNQQRRTVTVLLDNSRTVVAAWDDVVEKDEEEAAPSFRPPMDDESDEVDASLLAAIAERSARAEKLGESENEERPRGRRERRERDDRPRRERGERESRPSRRSDRRESGERREGRSQHTRRNKRPEGGEVQSLRRSRDSREGRGSRTERGERQGRSRRNRAPREGQGGENQGGAMRREPEA